MNFGIRAPQWTVKSVIVRGDESLVSLARVDHLPGRLLLLLEGALAVILFLFLLNVVKIWGDKMSDKPRTLTQILQVILPPSICLAQTALILPCRRYDRDNVVVFVRRSSGPLVHVERIRYLFHFELVSVVQLRHLGTHRALINRNLIGPSVLGAQERLRPTIVPEHWFLVSAHDPVRILVHHQWAGGFDPGMQVIQA